MDKVAMIMLPKGKAFDHKCSNCSGAGLVRCIRCQGDGKLNSGTCYYCDGRGTIECPACNGRGVCPD